MTINTLVCYAAALLSLSLAVLVLWRGSRSFAHRTLAIGMVLLAVDHVSLGLSLQTPSPLQIFRLYQFRMCLDSLFPGIWLLFSLSYGRENHREFLSRWKWIASILFALPLALIAAFHDSLLVNIYMLDSASGWLIQLGWAGRAVEIFLLIGTVIVLMNLEKTLRAFTGSMQWQIKFMVLALGGFCAVKIYLYSQALLYSGFETSLAVLSGGTLIVADLGILIALLRAHLSDIEIYLSPTLLFNSLTVLATGIYLLVAGVLAGLLGSLAPGSAFSLEFQALFMFLALMALALLLLSSQVRQRLKNLVHRHLVHPRYDYRTEWINYTQKTLSVLDLHELCGAVAKMVSETFAVPSVTIWLFDESRQSLNLGGSTMISAAESGSFASQGETVARLMQVLPSKPVPLDLLAPGSDSNTRIKTALTTHFRDDRIRYYVPLNAVGSLTGFMVLGERIDAIPFSLEDLDLLKTIALQTASNLLNLQLSERLRIAKQMEAFQSMSTFLVHDLKNLASTLSLTTQNLPIHFDNPEFREDAISAISQGVTKIKTMCSRLSSLNGKLELQLVESDLNALVNDTLSQLNGFTKGSVSLNLQAVPNLALDAEQLEKVVTNLLLNAHEAAGKKAQVRVETGRQGDWAVLSVSDNGCGIAPEFLQQSLFQPFKTTKKKGLGIGLFHSKKIVEAHGGKIEVESAEGKGSTFRVLLPLKN